MPRLRLPRFLALCVVAGVALTVVTPSSRVSPSVPETADLAITPLLRRLEREGRWDELRAVLDAAMVAVPSGWGVMGNDVGRPNERPARNVFLSGFRIDRYEVTNLQYAAFMSARGARAPVYWEDGHYPPGTASHPVVGVSWSEAAAYCAWSSKRLPTEAEWERSCRGPAGTTYPWGPRWESGRANITVVPLADPDDAWPWLVAGHGPAGLHPVGEPAGGASAYGVCNLADNAAEWLMDWYDPHGYETLPERDPVGEEPPWDHAVRGGAWLYRHREPGGVEDMSRCAFRNASHSHDDPRIGFRCAADTR